MDSIHLLSFLPTKYNVETGRVTQDNNPAVGTKEQAPYRFRGCGYKIQEVVDGAPIQDVGGKSLVCEFPIFVHACGQLHCLAARGVEHLHDLIRRNEHISVTTWIEL